jgi:hypothetical protein
MLFGFSFAQAQTASLATISAEQTGQATTLFNVQRQVGQALGVAVLATVLAAVGSSPPDLSGYHLAFLAAALIMVAGALIALRIRDADAAATMSAAVDSQAAAAAEA